MSLHYKNAPITDAATDIRLTPVEGISLFDLVGKLQDLRSEYPTLQAELIIAKQRFDNLVPKILENGNDPDKTRGQLSRVVNLIYSFHTEVIKAREIWQAPNLNALGEDVILEWWAGGKQLTLYVSLDGEIQYLKSWQGDADIEMEEGDADNEAIRLQLWNWLQQ